MPQWFITRKKTMFMISRKKIIHPFFPKVCIIGQIILFFHFRVIRLTQASVPARAILKKKKWKWYTNSIIDWALKPHQLNMCVISSKQNIREFVCFFVDGKRKRGEKKREIEEINRQLRHKWVHRWIHCSLQLGVNIARGNVVLLL